MQSTAQYSELSYEPGASQWAFRKWIGPIDLDWPRKYCYGRDYAKKGDSVSVMLREQLAL